MLIKLVNINNDVFLLESGCIYEIGPITNEDERGNAILFTTIPSKEGRHTVYSVMDSVEDIYSQILEREKKVK
jgi:hypothetical protein